MGLPAAVAALMAFGSVALCLRGWYRRLFRPMSFDEGMTHGMHLVLGTTFTLIACVIAVQLAWDWFKSWAPA